jgi:hypothetical protein
MFKAPDHKRSESLNRIKRNHKIYLAVFDKSSPLNLKTVYEIEVSVLLAETERQLDRSQNDISHVGFSESWAKQNGKVVYMSKKG